MKRAPTYNELKETLGRVYPDLPKQLQRIARFALDKPDETLRKVEQFKKGALPKK